LKRILFSIIVLTFYISNLYAQTPEKPIEKPQEETVEKKQQTPKSPDDKDILKKIELEKIELEKTEKVERYIKTANSLREIQNDYNGALGFYKKAIELDPNKASIHWYIAGVYWKLDNHAKALEHLETCRKLMPQVPEELNEVDDFIGKLVVYLNVEEKRGIAQKRVHDRREIMEGALKADKVRWEESTLVPAGEFWRVR